MSNTNFTKAERLGLLKSGLRPYINAELHIPNYYIETPHRIEPSLNLIYLPNSCNEYNLSYAKTAIEDVLSGLEGVRLRYDDFNCKWFLEFGEMSMYDICETEEEKQTCVNKRIAINDAVMEARQRFPHNITNNAGLYMVYNMYEIELTDNWEHIVFRRQSNYTKIEVCLYYVCYKSIDRNGCAVAINLKKGAYCALHPIFVAIEALVHSDGFSMWMERISYLALVEGTQHAYTDANTDHIKKYLFDPNISKELCNILGDFAKLW